MEEPVSHGFMQNPWQLRPQVASNVHLVRFAMSGGLICISLKWRPFIYKHQTVLLTNYLITMPQAINIGDHVPEVDWTRHLLMCPRPAGKAVARQSSAWEGPVGSWWAKGSHWVCQVSSFSFQQWFAVPPCTPAGLVKIHQPGWRRCSEIFSVAFNQVTHVKIGQNKKPPRGDNILGEETQKDYGKEKTVHSKYQFPWLPGADWLMPWKLERS